MRLSQRRLSARHDSKALESSRRLSARHDSKARSLSEPSLVVPSASELERALASEPEAAPLAHSSSETVSGQKAPPPSGAVQLLSSTRWTAEEEESAVSSIGGAQNVLHARRPQRVMHGAHGAQAASAARDAEGSPRRDTNRDGAECAGGRPKTGSGRFGSDRSAAASRFSRWASGKLGSGKGLAAEGASSDLTGGDPNGGGRSLRSPKSLRDSARDSTGEAEALGPSRVAVLGPGECSGGSLAWF